MTEDEKRREFNARVDDLLCEWFGEDVAAWGLVLTEDTGKGDMHVIANHSAHHCLTLLCLGILRLQDHIGEKGFIPAADQVREGPCCPPCALARCWRKNTAGTRTRISITRRSDVW